jgi:hypothetical protein
VCVHGTVSWRFCLVSKSWGDYIPTVSEHTLPLGWPQRQPTTEQWFHPPLQDLRVLSRVRQLTFGCLAGWVGRLISTQLRTFGRILPVICTAAAANTTPSARQSRSEARVQRDSSRQPPQTRGLDADTLPRRHRAK